MDGKKFVCSKCEKVYESNEVLINEGELGQKTIVICCTCYEKTLNGYNVTIFVSGRAHSKHYVKARNKQDALSEVMEIGRDLGLKAIMLKITEVHAL